MHEASLLLKIPKERVGVVVGLKGNVRRKIEDRLGVELKVESSGDVEIRIKLETNDPSLLFRARDIVMAIGRGFSPERAFRLIDEDANIGVINLRDYFGKSKSNIERIKGRIIGSNGKTRRLIEELTGVDISVYGYTVTIIGELFCFEVAREAIEMLIKGKMHRTVYQFLNRKRDDVKKEDMRIWNTSLAELDGKESKSPIT